MSAKTTALAIRINGEIIESNFPAFKAAALATISDMNFELLNEGDFTKAKENIKSLKITEDALVEVKDGVLKQMDDVYALMGEIDEIGNAARECRLAKSKEVKKRDAEIKERIVNDALATIDHPKREKFRPDITESLKRKKTFETMGQGAKKAAQAINDRINATRSVLEEFADVNGTKMILDASELELSLAGSVEFELKHRLEKQRDEEEKQELRLKAALVQKELDEQAKKDPEVLAPTPEPLPVPPKIESIPVGNAAKEALETPEEEALRALTSLESLFPPIKQLRANLKHKANREHWQAFADGLTQLYLSLKNSTK